MADATASLRIKADADVGGAVAGLQRLDSQVSQATTAGQTMTSTFRDVAAGVLTAELAMRALETGLQLVGAGMTAVVADSEELTKRSEVLAGSVDDLTIAFGRAIFGGVDLESTLEQLRRVVDAFAGRLDTAAESQTKTTEASSALISVLQTLTTATTYARGIWDGFVIIVEGAVAAFTGLGQAVVGVGALIRDSLGVALGAVVSGFGDLLETATVLAGTFGVELPDGFLQATQAVQGFGREVSASVNPARVLDEALASVRGTFEQFGEDAAQRAMDFGEFALQNEALVNQLGMARDITVQASAANKEYNKTLAERTAATVDNASAIREQTQAMNAQDAAMYALIESFNATGAAERERVREYLNGRRAMMEADTMLAGQLATAATINDQNAAGLERLAAAADALVFRYTAAGQAVESLRTTGALFASEFGEGVSAAFEAALGSADSLEDFTRAVRAALGSALVSSGAQTILEGLKSLIPIPGLFNPAAAAVALPLGATMVATGRAFGGRGSAPSGGGRSVGESGGSSTGVAGAPAPDAGPRSISATNWDGLTIITEDPDTFRRLGRGLERTEAIGMGATI